MSTFALVHGGWHGAWCWKPLTPLLRECGHRVVAMDLPCGDPNADFDTYADVVCEALGETDGDVVVVGHSLAGLTIPLVAARRAVRHLVYLCALLPQPGRSWAEQVAEEPDMMCPGPPQTSGRVGVDTVFAHRDACCQNDIRDLRGRPDGRVRLGEADGSRPTRRRRGRTPGESLAVPVAAAGPCRRTGPDRPVLSTPKLIAGAITSAASC